MDHPEALSYLSGRAIEPEAAIRFQLGFVSPDAPSEHQRYVGRLAIPYLKRCGVVGFKFRCIGEHDCKDEGHAKYLTIGPSQPWGILALDEPGTTVDLAEGEIDALTLWGVLGVPAIGFPGVDFWSGNEKVLVRLLKDYKRIRLWADPDKAGLGLAAKVQEALPQTDVIDLPDDVNATLVTHGPGYLAEVAGL